MGAGVIIDGCLEIGYGDREIVFYGCDFSKFMSNQHAEVTKKLTKLLKII